MEFKSPERFNPDKFGVQYPLVAREADVYAFGMTIFQVLVQYCKCGIIVSPVASRSLQVIPHSPVWGKRR